MDTIASLEIRRTSADIVFERLYQQIMSMTLKPGSRISEAEVAEQFGVSRQPVRDAFIRLGYMELLRIKPQRATEVQKFSQKSIDASRFVRLAIELEVSRDAMRQWTSGWNAVFQANLAAQAKALADHDIRYFHELDLEFHKLICDVAKSPVAYDIIVQKKAHMERICASQKTPEEMEVLLADHHAIFDALSAQDAPAHEQVLRKHVHRIDVVIDEVRQTHASFFED